MLDSAPPPLQVTLHEARDLPVWGFPWQSNPYCRITLGSQAEQVRAVGAPPGLRLLLAALS